MTKAPMTQAPARTPAHPEAHPDILLVLTHFSPRHSDQDVLGFFRDERPDNVLLGAQPDSRLPEQHRHGGAHD
ncbi:MULTISPECIES: hypothetical protein [unclassified Streptomyces]|uniref:hypothetical protein n=1 Tax=unclassified Streptomyces TaxID=2593676 RepID=UPI0036565639